MGDLNLSTGGLPRIEYGLCRQDGSQIALSLMRRWQVEGDRIDGARLLAWARGLAGTDDVVMRVLQNKLVAYVDGENNLHGGIQGEPWTITESWEGKPSGRLVPNLSFLNQHLPRTRTTCTTPVVSAPAPAAVVNDEGMVATVIEVVVHHTGYPADFVELDQDLEGELGIDTVKQAEIMADIREKFGLPVDEDFVLADYPGSIT